MTVGYISQTVWMCEAILFAAVAYIILSPTSGWSEVSGGGVLGGRVPPRDFWPGNFCWRIRKKEARKNGKRGENWEEKKENCKREGGKLEMEVGKVIKRGEDLVFCLFVCLFWFFFFAFHFWKRRKFVLGLRKWDFYTGKKHFTLG